MIAIIQRVSEAWVSVDKIRIASIEHGLMVLVGIERQDTTESVRKMVKKLLNYRVFSDQDGKMNLSLQQCEGELLLVPQFTLAADTKQGMRPGFSAAASPKKGRETFDILVAECQTTFPRTQQGKFGADMQVGLINDGPVTFSFQIS